MIELIIFLVLGLIGLWVGADFLIKGTKNIAEHFGISPFIIGLAFVSIGTSLPEIAVSVTAGFSRLGGVETSGIVIGNALGSSLSQISLLFGILAFLVPLRLNKKMLMKHGPFLIAAVLLVFGLAADGFLSRIDGIILVCAYLAYYFFLWYSNHVLRPGRKVTMHVVKDIVHALIGLGLILFASKIVVTNGIGLADIWGVKQSLVGILLIGIGTGLPELSIAIAGFKRKAMGISMGTLIGSNLCDLLFSLGAGAIVAGFVIDKVNLWFDLPVLLIFSFIVLYFLYTGRRVSKREGTLLIGLFVLYALLKIFVTG